MASKHPTQNQGTSNLSLFLAVEAQFELGDRNKSGIYTLVNENSSGASIRTELINYFGRISNGGGEVLGCITPWKGDCSRALIIFDEEYCASDIVESVIENCKKPVVQISRYTEPQYFGRARIPLSALLQEKLLKYGTIEELSSEIERDTAIVLKQDRETGRLILEGFLLQLKLAEECLKRLEGLVDNYIRNIAEKETEGSNTAKLGNQTPSAQDGSPLHEIGDKRVGDTEPDIESEEDIEDDEDNSGEIEKANGSIGNPPNPKEEGEVPMVVDSTDAEPDTTTVTEEELEETDQEEGDDSASTMVQEELEEEFDWIYYEFMEIVLEDQYRKEVLDVINRKKCSIAIREDPKDARKRFVKIRGHRKDVQHVMTAINELFSQTIRQAHSHTVKLLYVGGDLEGLSKALVKDLRGNSIEFVARLATNTDIRIISYLRNMDLDISIVENFVEDYKQKHPAGPPPPVQAPEVIVLDKGIILKIIDGDLTRMKCDVIVSSSSPDLSNASGVSRAIADQSGQTFQYECERHVRNNGLLHTGDTFVQIGQGRLASKYGVRQVIHVIAPRPETRNAAKKLKKVMLKALSTADSKVYRSLAFPAIGSAFPGFFEDVCLAEYWNAIQEFVATTSRPYLQEISFVCNDPCTVILIQTAMRKYSQQHPSSTRSHGHSRASAIGGGSRRSPNAQEAWTWQTDQNQNGAGMGSGTTYANKAASLSGSGKHGLSNHFSAASNSSSSSGLAAIHGPASPQGVVPRGTDASGSYEYSDLSGGYGMAGSSGGAASAGTMAAGAASAAASAANDDRDNECPICMDVLKHPQKLQCGHQFCKACMDGVVSTSKSNLCPTCRAPFTTAEGKQPKGGRMRVSGSSHRLPGYERYNTIVINYDIQPGVQGQEHPHPGQHHGGTHRTAYLPDSAKGQKVSKLLKKAFDQRLIFTIGQSITTGVDNCVVWNDIHHKTNMTGGPSSYGYPDPDYLDRVIEDLKAKGITE